MLVDTAARQEALTALREELAALPSLTASIVALHHLEELSVAEVAHLTGLSVDACKQRLSRGREELRQRLERRGVALASIAVFTLLVDELFSASSAMAAEIESSVFEAITREALSPSAVSHGAESSHAEAHSDAASAGHSTTSTGTACDHAENTSAEGSRPSLESSGAEGIGTMHKILALITLALTVLALAFLNSGRSTSVMQAAGQPPPAPVVQSKSIVKVEPQFPVAARWQSTRLIPTEALPDKVLVSGERIAISCGGWPNAGFITSNDGGKTWKIGKQARSPEGEWDAVMQANGDVFEMRTRRLTPGEPDQSKQKIALESQSIRVDTAPGLANRMKNYETGQCYISAPNLAQVREGVWAFILESPVDLFDRPKVLRAYFGRGTAVPTPVNSFDVDASFSNVTAWARDDLNAGVILLATEPDGKQLQLTHFSTNDGARKWNRSVIPCNIEDGSRPLDFPARPTDICRSGDRLTLVVCARFTTKSPRSEQDVIYTLTSSDLGLTWDSPVQVNEKISDRQYLHGPKIASASGRLFVFGRYSNLKFRDFSAYNAGAPGKSIFYSDDNGAHWQPWEGVKDLGEGEYLACGGDGESFHAACGDGKRIFVRSYTKGHRDDSAAPSSSSPDDKAADGEQHKF
jgi:hypothetical protein